MIYTYSHLLSLWRCPRRLGYELLGYEPPARGLPIWRGQFTHEALASYWRGTSIDDAIAKALLWVLDGLSTLPEDKRGKWAEEAIEAARQAKDFATRYIQRYGSTLTPRAVEETIVLGEIGGTPDLVGVANGQNVVVELKTGDVPDILALQHSPQADYYAVLWMQAKGEAIGRIYLDIVSPDYLTRVERLPNRDKGFYVLRELANVTYWVGNNPQALLERPRYLWDCHKCPYFHPCQVRDAGGDDKEILEQEYLRKEMEL